MENLTAATLCFLRRGNEVLLARKTRSIGEGLYNGYGGGIESGETPEVAALRELEEECGVRGNPDALRMIALVEAHHEKTDGEEFICRIHVFALTGWTGEPQPSEEMEAPDWFDVDDLPYSEMMVADRSWVPVVLAAPQPVSVRVWYGQGQKSLRHPVWLSVLTEAVA